MASFLLEINSFLRYNVFMKQTKIIFISRAYPPIVGGIENQNYELAKWLGEIAEVKIIANTKGKKFLPLFLPYASVKVLFDLRKYDVLLLGDGVLGITGWISKIFYPKKPVLCVVHGLDLTFQSGIYQRLWVKFFLKKLDKLIAVGNETVRVAVEKGISTEKIVFIPNGVDTEKHLIDCTRADLERIIGQTIEHKNILMTSGRLSKRKGVAWFIANVMPTLGKEFLYVVAGSGNDKKKIEQQIKNNNLGKRVITLGYISDEDRNILWNSADLFVQPNITVPGDMEGFGISVIEAGACKLPVLASDMEGLRDAIKDGKNGFLIESENAAAYIKKITELFAQGSPRNLFGQSVRDYVIENYRWEKIAQQYLEEIQKVAIKP